MEQLKLIANGVFSNVYSGRLTDPEQLTIVIKKTWSKGSYFYLLTNKLDRICFLKDKC